VRRRHARTHAQDGLHAATAPLLPPAAPAAHGHARRAKPTLASAALLPCLFLCAALAAASPHDHGTPALHARGGPGPVPHPPSLCGAAPRPPWASALGDALGWASAAAYAASRVSQLRRNAARAAGAEGLAPAMFALAIAGNALYAASVLLRLNGTFADVARAAPWLAGSLGVLAMDAVIVGQARAAQKRAEAAEAADVDDDGDGGAAEAGEGYAPPPAVLGGGGS
jgi:hypothetical protein